MKTPTAAFALVPAVPAAAFADSPSLLELHDGYWVTETQADGQQAAMTVINDMHVDTDTMKITVFAQARVLGRAVSPPQVERGECLEIRGGQTQCHHPNAVYLNGRGERLTASDGTGAWWVEHSWVLGGEGYHDTELMPPQFDPIWHCMNERSAFDGVARGCPSATQ